MRACSLELAVLVEQAQPGAGAGMKPIADFHCGVSIHASSMLGG
jgi:hypothetical protein